MATLEQRRAQDAWQKCEQYHSEHVNIAKGLPALIINSGLMQVLAFMHQKQKDHEFIASQLRSWLASRFPESITDAKFDTFMECLMKADPQTYQDITSEAFAWLKWLRQLAAARKGGN